MELGGSWCNRGPLTGSCWYQPGPQPHVNPANLGSQTLRLQRGAAPFTFTFFGSKSPAGKTAFAGISTLGWPFFDLWFQGREAVGGVALGRAQGGKADPEVDDRRQEVLPVRTELPAERLLHRPRELLPRPRRPRLPQTPQQDVPRRLGKQ